jgi:hypothetical protein
MTKARDLASGGAQTGLVRIIPSSTSNSGGSVSITTTGVTSFTTVNSVSFNSVFDKNKYDYFQILLWAHGSIDPTNLNFKWRMNTTDDSDGYYGSGWTTNYAGGSGIYAAKYQSTDFPITKISGNLTSIAFVTMDVHLKDGQRNAYLTGQTFTGSGAESIPFSYNGNGASDIDGFSLIANQGTMTGKIQIFGFTK